MHPATKKTLAGLAILGCAAILLAHAGAFVRFTVDDSFISYRYAENLAAGEGLTYNPGERVEGYSNFLWVLLLGGVRRAGGDVLLGSKILGVLSLLAVLYFSFRCLRELTGERAWGIGLLFVLATNFPLVFFSITGMETGFYAAILTGIAWLQVRGSAWRNPYGLPLSSFAASLTRPEGILLFPFQAIAETLRSRRIPRRLLASVCVFSALYAAFLLWRFRYFGQWFPNTFFAKPMRISANLPPVISGFDDLYRFVVGTGGPLFLGAVALAFLHRETRARVGPLLPVLLAVLAFQLYSGGDWMGNYRFLVPLVPVYSVAGFFALWWLLRTALGGRFRAAFPVLVALLALSNATAGAQFYLTRDRYPNFILTSEDLVPAGRWIGGNYLAHYQVAAFRIGALGYYSGLYVIDTLGLTDPVIAQARFHGNWNSEKEEEYLRGRNPELILDVARREARPEESVTRGGREYRFVRQFRQGSTQIWILYERADLREEPDSEESRPGQPTPGASAGGRAAETRDGLSGPIHKYGNVWPADASPLAALRSLRRTAASTPQSRALPAGRLGRQYVTVLMNWTT